ncbi:MAG: TerB family tellurite resistance protein [Bacteroidales bacterium]|jgi:DnaJ like chaperone protein|nr:TerB family tellurite resistance protein [Bacteroidales bacterium]
MEYKMNRGGCFIPFLFSVIGSYLAGFAGSILGLIAGFGVMHLFGQRNNGRTASIGNDILESITKLSLILMKADNNLMRSELYLFRDFMIRNFGQEAASVSIDMLQQYQDRSFTVEEATRGLSEKLNYTERIQILRFLFQLAMVDNPINSSELSILSRIAQSMGIHQADFLSLRTTFEFLYNQQHARTEGYYSNRQQSSYTGRGNSASESDYALMGVKSTDSDDEIKAAYRRMAVANHPDKVQHLGEVARAKAEKRFSEINQAYSRIKKARNLS